MFLNDNLNISLWWILCSICRYFWSTSVTKFTVTCVEFLIRCVEQSCHLHPALSFNKFRKIMVTRITVLSDIIIQNKVLILLFAHAVLLMQVKMRADEHVKRYYECWLMVSATFNEFLLNFFRVLYLVPPSFHTHLLTSTRECSVTMRCVAISLETSLCNVLEMLKKELFALSIHAVADDFIVRYTHSPLLIRDYTLPILCARHWFLLVIEFLSKPAQTLLVQYTEAQLYKQLTHFYRLLDASRLLEKVFEHLLCIDPHKLFMYPKYAGLESCSQSHLVWGAPYVFRNESKLQWRVSQLGIIGTGIGTCYVMCTLLEQSWPLNQIWRKQWTIKAVSVVFPMQWH